jgi:hypothetical protein
MHQSFVNRVTIENSKKRYARQSPAGGLVDKSSDAKAIYPRHFNSITTTQISGKEHSFGYNKLQYSKLYSPANTPHYYYRNKSTPSTELDVFN